MTFLFIPSHPAPSHSEALSMRGIRGYMALFRSRPLVLLIVNLLFLFVPYWVFVGMSPLLYIKDFGVSLAHFGYYQGVLAIVFTLGSIIFGLIINNVTYDNGNILKFGSIILVISFAILSVATYLETSDPLVVTVNLFTIYYRTNYTLKYFISDLY